MSSAKRVTERASEQARFAAREFAARYEHETGTTLSVVVVQHVLFAFEMGYLCGHRDGVGLRARWAADEMSRVISQQTRMNDGPE